MDQLKKRAKSKTYYLAVAVSALGAAQVALPGIQDQLKDYYGLVTLGVGVAIAVLREMTKNAVSDK